MIGTATKQPAVYVIDDDASVRKSLENLLRSVDLHVESFTSPALFLEHKPVERPACIILDIRMPGSSGLDFQSELISAHINLPVIFLTGHGDIPMSVQAMKAGAIDFLTKPYREQDLIDAVMEALKTDEQRLSDDERAREVRARFDGLSKREKSWRL